MGNKFRQTFLDFILSLFVILSLHPQGKNIFLVTNIFLRKHQVFSTAFGRISREAKVNQIAKSIKSVNKCLSKLLSVVIINSKVVILRVLKNSALCNVFT